MVLVSAALRGLPQTGEESGDCAVRATHYQWCSFTSHEAWGRTGAQNQVVDSRLAYNRCGDGRIRNQSRETLRKAFFGSLK